MIRVKVATDAEVGIAVRGGLIPWADMLPETFKTLRPDSSNGEFTTNVQTCCAYYLDYLNEAIYNVYHSALPEFNKKYEAKGEVVLSALHKVNKSLYRKFGTPQSTMSGCNPSRHINSNAEYAEVFDGMSYEEVLFKYGSPMGTHLHVDISAAQAKSFGLVVDEKWRIQTEQFDNAKLSESIKKIITLAMIPTMYIMRNSGDDDAIIQRFKLLPLGYFRVKKYGIEFKDFPSTILRTPWYAAAAMMALRTAVYFVSVGNTLKINTDEAYTKLMQLDHDYIAKAFSAMVDHSFLRVDSSLSTEGSWKKLSAVAPKSTDVDWEWKRHFSEAGEYRNGHLLGLESCAWNVK